MLILVIGIAITLLDQITKYMIRMGFALGETRPILDGFFDLTYLRNTGAAWGMFGGQNGPLIILSVVMLALLIIFRRSFVVDCLIHRLAMGLMLGGIIGNLIDRIRLGWVTDFLDFYIKGHHWPSFNVADAAICTGVGLYIISSWWIAQHPLRDGVGSKSLELPEDTGSTT